MAVNVCLQMTNMYACMNASHFFEQFLAKMHTCLQARSWSSMPSRCRRRSRSPLARSEHN